MVVVECQGTLHLQSSAAYRNARNTPANSSTELLRRTMPRLTARTECKQQRYRPRKRQHRESTWTSEELYHATPIRTARRTSSKIPAYQALHRSRCRQAETRSIERSCLPNNNIADCCRDIAPATTKSGRPASVAQHDRCLLRANRVPSRLIGRQLELRLNDDRITGENIGNQQAGRTA